MPRVERDIVKLFASVRLSEDTVYLTTADGTLLRTNQGWTQFARDNAGAAILQRWARGSNVFDAIPEVLRAYYASAFSRALTTDQPWTHEYECSSAEQARRFLLRLYPSEGRYLLFVHSRSDETPHAGVAHEPDTARYASDGIITMCSHCRCVRAPRASLRWDWVPGFVTKPPANLSHGLCEACNEHYYP